MFNQIILIGYLGSAPVVRKTAAGKSVSTIELATDEIWRDAQGNKQKRTTWHKVQCWGGHADTVAAHCGKGSLLQVTGTYIDEEAWTDKQGVKRQNKICRLNSLTLMPDKNRQQPAQQQQQAPAAPKKDCAFTYEQMKANDWTDELLQQHGYGHLIPSVPKPPTAPSVPKPPTTPVGDQGFNVPDDMEPPIDYGV